LVTKQQERGVDADTAMFCVEVATPLVATAGASTSIPVLVSMRGGDDITFYGPKIPLGEPWISGQAPTRHAHHQSALPALAPHHGQNNCVRTKYHFGEAITSLRQLVKREQYVGQFNATADTSIAFAPWQFAEYNRYQPNYIDYYATIYRACAGGMRMLLISGSGTGLNGCLQATADDMSDTVVSGLAYVLPTIWQGPGWMVNATAFGEIGLAEEMVSAEIPWYNPMRLMPVALQGDSAGVIADQEDGNYPGGTWTFYNRGTTAVWTFRAAADDFNFGYMVGCPWLVFPSLSKEQQQQQQQQTQNQQVQAQIIKSGPSEDNTRSSGDTELELSGDGTRVPKSHSGYDQYRASQDEVDTVVLSNFIAMGEAYIKALEKSEAAGDRK
jgi:hypothetical protein